MFHLYLCTSSLIDAIKLGQWLNPFTYFLVSNESQYYGDNVIIYLFEFKDTKQVMEMETRFKKQFYNNLSFGKNLYQKKDDLEKQYIEFLCSKALAFKVIPDILHPSTT
jgi:hypothetical protein